MITKVIIRRNVDCRVHALFGLKLFPFYHLPKGARQMYPDSVFVAPLLTEKNKQVGRSRRL